MNTTGQTNVPHKINQDATTNMALLEKLQHVTEMVSNANKGMEVAQQETDNEALRELFQQTEQMHERHYTALAEMLTYYRLEPDNDGTIAGALHRTWMNVKNAISDNDEAAILEAVRFGEQQLLDTYDDALSTIQFPSERQDDHDKIADQRNDVAMILERIQRLHEYFSRDS